MKIYFELPEEGAKQFSEVDTSQLPDEFRDFAQSLLRTCDSLSNNLMLTLREKQKYSLMWHLRSLEAEIEQEGGMIIISKDSEVKMTDFTPELKDKIEVLLENYK